MPQYNMVANVKLPQYSTYGQHDVNLEECPMCHNERLSKTPRRAPTFFHCKQCGFMANVNDVHTARWMLGQKVA